MLKNKLKEEEELEKLRAAEAKKRLFKMLELEKQGIQRDENWNKEEEKGEDVVENYIKIHG